MTERDYLIGLTHYLKFGPASLKRLYSYNQNWEAVYQIPLSEMIKLGINSELASDFNKWRTTFNLTKSLELIEQEQIKVLFEDEVNYPEPLRNINQPPLVIYYRGTLSNSLWPRSLSVVGSRRYSSYGERVIGDLIGPVASQGVTIISGLALGIDALAHQAALKAQGLTVAVLGSGIDRGNLYPTSNRNLAEAIVNHHGAVMTEFPPGTPGLTFNFPRRNRIIAGLSKGTLVIEAAIKSGSLITARYALDYGKEIMAIPSHIYSIYASGTNLLIQQGAKLISSSQDIMDALALNASFATDQPIKIEDLDPVEAVIVELLYSGNKTINELTKESKLDISQINARLSLMEIKGLIHRAGPSVYTLSKVFKNGK